MAFHFSKRKLRVKEPDEVGELNIVPYLDIMMNLIMFMLLSMTGLVSFGVLYVSAPKYVDSAQMRSGEEVNEPKLLLTVLISEKGLYLADSGGLLTGRAGGADGSAQPTIARGTNGEYDFDMLTAEVIKAIARYPKEAKSKAKALVGADPRIPYQTLVRTMDAIRENPHGEGDDRKLIADVSLTVM